MKKEISNIFCGNIINSKKLLTDIYTGGVLLTSVIIPGCKDNPQQSGQKPSFNRPNIIFLLTDDQRWDALGCAGNSIIQTPNMDKLAEKGVRFENAFVTSPICAASRASIFTGLYERTHKYTFTKPPIKQIFTDISYPVQLKRAGYRTGFIGKFGIKVEEGVIDSMFDWRKLTYFPYFKEIDGEERHLTEINGDHAIEFLRDCKPGQPFCLSLSFWAPHAEDDKKEQYFWPPACNTMYENDKIPIPETADPAFFETHPEFLKKSMNRIRWYWRYDTPKKHQKMVKGYYRMISGVDIVIGRLMEELKYLKLDKNTIIILMADNGYFTGERGFAGKWLMHEHSLRVPLIIYDPRETINKQNKVLKEMVLNIDIAPTILELAGIKVPEMIQGKSLVPLLNAEKFDWRSSIFCEHLWDLPEIPQSECIRNEQWKYIRYPQHPDFIELYDLKNDPLEKINLAYKSGFRDQIQKFQRQCNQIIQSLTISGDKN